MKVLIVMTFEVPSPDNVIDIVKAIDPQKLPHFARIMNIVVEPHASELSAWLEAPLTEEAADEAPLAQQRNHTRHLIALELLDLKASYNERGEWDHASVVDRVMGLIDRMDLS